MTSSANKQRQFALEIVERLRAAGHEAFWAGGCVRDQLLGRAPKDYDVATSALPDQVRDVFGRQRTLEIGAAFGVITVLGGRPRDPVEVATFRNDGDYLDGRRPSSVSYTDAEHDAQRRDLTINGLFYDPVSDEVVDYVGGQRDLQAGVVRAIGDANKRFEEDKLRMLRAIRFAATFEFTIDDATLAAIQRMAHQASVVSAERTGGELQPILEHPNRREGVRLLRVSRLLSVLLPELADRSVQDETAWQTKLAQLDRAGDDASLPVALAILLLDVCSPGASVDVCRRFRFSNKVSGRTKWLLANAADALRAALLPWPKLQRLLVHEGAPEMSRLLTALLPADDPSLKRWRERLALPPEELNPPPLISGDDLIAAGLTAGAALCRFTRTLARPATRGAD